MSYIKVTAEELGTISGTLKTAAGNIASENARALAQVQGLVGAGWEGAASEQFNSLFTQWKTSADSIQQALDGISTLLSGAGQQYADAEERIRQSMTS